MEMLLLNILIFLLMLICFLFSPANQRYIFIPQCLSLLLVLNKDSILTKLGSVVEFIKINRPTLNHNKSEVIIHCSLNPKKNKAIFINRFRTFGKGYIHSIECPPGHPVDHPYSFSLNLDVPTEIIFKIKSYPNLSLSRFMTLWYNSNSLPKSKYFTFRHSK
jgi:hypothetical protein